MDSVIPVALLAAASAAASFFLLLLAIPVLRRLGWVDKPQQAKIHKSPIPTMGGIALLVVFQVFFVVALFALGLGNGLTLSDFIFIELAVAVTIASGVIDDLRGMKAWQKIGFQAIAALLIAAGITRINFVTWPFGQPLVLPEALSFALTCAWFVVIMNAVNIIDGLDGLLGMYSVTYFSAFIFIGLIHQQNLTTALAVIMAGASVGFLLLNFPPARIFLGNTGSNFVGFMVALLPLFHSIKGEAVISLVPVLIVLFYPLFDLTIAFFRRLLARRNPFRGDLEHFHHRIYFSNGNSYLVIFMGIFLFSATLSVICTFFSPLLRLYIFAANLALVSTVLISIKYKRRTINMDKLPAAAAAGEEPAGQPATAPPQSVYSHQHGH